MPYKTNKDVKKSVKLKEAKRMKYDKVIKKLKDGEWDTSMDVKQRMHLTYTDNNTGKKKVVFVESFKFFFESKDADIEDLIKMIKNPDPSKVKEYGGTKYVDMLKKKLARLEEDEQVKVRKGGAGNAFYTGTRVEKDKKKEKLKKLARGKVKEEDAQDGAIYIDKGLIYPYSDYGYRYKGYQLEVQKETEPGERDFYHFNIYDKRGNKLNKPNNIKLINNYGEINEENFKSYIDSLSNNEDAEDRCKKKADSVYGKKTSAYKSGAIVRCRDGKIWKK